MTHHPMTPDDLWTLPRVGVPAPSPDGKRFVVPVTTYDLKTNEGTTRLWLGDRALTTAEANAGQPAWSPDGTRIAFVRKAPGPKSLKHPDQPQLFVIPADGGEAERLTDLPLGVADPRWFPDGKRIAFLAAVYADAPTIEETEKLHKKRQEEPVKARVTEDRIYRYWDQWLTDGLVFHIFVIDLETRRLTDLTPDSRRWFDLMEPVDQFRISPDGKEIAFSACRSKPPYDPAVWGVFLLNVATRRTTCITEDHPAHAVRPVYSPDGRYVLYGMQRELEFYADRVRLATYDRRTRTHTVLTEDWDRSARGWTWPSREIYFVAEDNARTAIFSLVPGQKPKEIVRGGNLSAPQIAGGRMYFSMDSITQPPEVYVFDNVPRRLTRFTEKVMRNIELPKVEEHWFTGAEGHRVQMFVVNPGPRPRPLVHLIHGGPHGMFGDQWHWRWNSLCFAAPGYTVALVNFHGSTSWGQDFAKCIQGRWGDQPYKDLMAATDYLIQRGIADPKRMAAAGGSYGGYLASWIASQTDRFACIVNHAGVADLQMEWASDVTYGWEQALGGAPWQFIEGMDRYNPVRHAKGFRSPMLILHGERDFRVPYDQGIEIYNIYKGMKLPARLVVYPDENHWILKPRNSLHWYGEVLGWLARWLRPSKKALQAKACERVRIR